MLRPVDAHGPIPARSQLTDQLKQVIEGGGGLRDQAGFASGRWPVASGSNPNLAARAIEDLKRSGYRPLHPCPKAPRALVHPGGAHRQRAPRVETTKGRDAGEP